MPAHFSFYYIFFFYYITFYEWKTDSMRKRERERDIYLFGNFVVWIFGVVATKLYSSKCKYFCEFSIGCHEFCWLSTLWWFCCCWWIPLLLLFTAAYNDGDNVIETTAFALPFWILLVLSSLVSLDAVARLSIKLCMFIDNSGGDLISVVDVDGTNTPNKTNNVLVAYK